MTLLDRYLQAVRFWLPKEQQDDILAELSEDLHSEIDEREAELGRKLNESEMAALLVKRGRPIAVASGYRTQHALIGPLLFPAYILALRVAFACFAVLWIALPIALILFSASYRGDHSALELVGRVWSSAWLAAVTLFGVVTLVFAALERAQAKSKFLETWDPHKLPALRKTRDPRRIPRASSIVEIFASCVLSAWWVDASPMLHPPAAVDWMQSAIWAEVHRSFYLVFLLLMLVWMAMACANLVRPTWTRLRLALRAAMNAAGSSMLIIALVRHSADAHAQLAAIRDSAGASSAELDRSVLDLAVYGALSVSAVISVSCLLYEVFRVVRWNAKPAWTPSTGEPVGLDLPREP